MDRGKTGGCKGQAEAAVTTKVLTLHRRHNIQIIVYCSEMCEFIVALYSGCWMVGVVGHEAKLQPRFYDADIGSAPR